MIDILMFKVLIFLLLIGSSVQASCIKDVFKVGAGFDSLILSGERGSDNLDLVSDSGLSLRFNWIVYCPDSGLEISPYFYFRNYTFSKFDDGGEVEEFNSASIGSTFLKTYSFGDLFFDIFTREEIGVGQGEGIEDITDVYYDNLGVLGGYGFNYYKGGSSRMDAKAAAGILIPSEDQFDTGFVVKLSTDFLYKISKKLSLVFDIYLEHYEQNNSNIDLYLSREEFGINSSIIFRI